MSDAPLTYGTVAQAIGEVCIWWAAVEECGQRLIARLAVLLNDNFRDDITRGFLVLALANTKQREVYATAKLFAHCVTDPPDFYQRVEALLSYVDNELRPERNRLVHDSWGVDGDEVVKIERGAKLQKQTQTRPRTMVINSRTTYAEFAEIDAVARKLKQAASDFEDLFREIERMIDAKAPPPESP